METAKRGKKKDKSDMQRLLITLVFIVVGYFEVAGQTLQSGIGANFGNNILIGESIIAESKFSPNLGIYGIYHISEKLSAKLQVSYGQLNGNLPNSKYKTPIVPVELLCLYSFSPIFKVTPFLHIGAGGIGFRVYGDGPFMDAMVIGGGGFEIRLNSKFSWQLSSDFRYTTGDDFNHLTGGLNDGYVSVQTGITYNFKKSGVNNNQKQKEPKRTILAQQKLDEEEELLRIRIADLKNKFAKSYEDLEYLKLVLRTHNKNVEQLAFQIADYIQKNKNK